MAEIMILNGDDKNKRVIIMIANDSYMMILVINNHDERSVRKIIERSECVHIICFLEEGKKSCRTGSIYFLRNRQMQVLKRVL